MCAVIVDLLSQLPFGVSPDAACTGTIESQVDSIVYTVTVDAVAAADAADFVNGAPADVVISDELSSVTDSTIDIVSVQAAAVPTTDCSAANPLIANRCLDCCDFQDTPGCAQCAPMFSCCPAEYDCSAANPLIANGCLNCCNIQDIPACQASCVPMFSCCPG